MIERLRENAFDPNDVEGSRMRLGTNLRSLRTLTGFSLRDLSRKIGINTAYLSRVETGKVPCSPRVLEKIADELHAPRFELALQAGFFFIDWDKVDIWELEALRETIDSGRVPIEIFRLESDS